MIGIHTKAAEAARENGMLKSQKMTRDAAICLAEELCALQVGTSWLVRCDVGGDASYDAWYVELGL